MKKEKGKTVKVVKLTPIIDDRLFWMTFAQIKKAKGVLKPGSFGMEAVFYNFIFTYKGEKISEAKYNTLKKSLGCAGKNNPECANLKKIPFLRYYKVFNERDIEGVDFDKQRRKIEAKSKKFETEVEKIDAAECIIKNMPNKPKMIERYIGKGQSPNYQPTRDIVEMPQKSQYDNVAIWYGTAFHELCHATGHESRLGRKGITDFDGFGSPSYAFEELVAELGSAFLNAESGIFFHTLKKNAAYIKGWKQNVVKMLQKDNKAIFKAAGQAQKAADYILARAKDGTPKYYKDLNQNKTLKTNSTKKSEGKQSKMKEAQLALFGAGGQINISSEDFANMKVGELRRYTLEYYQRVFKGKKVDFDKLVSKIELTTEGGRKIAYGGPIYKEKVSALIELEKLIKRSTYNNWGNRKANDNKHILGYLNFKSKLTIDGKKRHVRISLTVYSNVDRPQLKSFDVGKKSNKNSGHSSKVSKRQSSDGEKQPLSNYKNKKTHTNIKKSLGTVVINVPVGETQPSEQQGANEGLAPVAVLDKIKPIEPAQKEVKKPTLPVEKKKETTSFNELRKLGFITADNTPSEPKGVFVLPNAIGQFIQKIQPHKALILIKGTKHTSKSQIAMQIANAFGENEMPVAYIDYEQGGLESKDTIDSVNRNTTPEGRKNIAIIGFLETPFEDLKEFCQHVKVVVADSVTDLGITADQLNELRTSYPGVIWVFISQVKENGEMYGGNKMAHNPTAIIKCFPDKNPEGRYATLEKNRGNDLDLFYSIFHQELISDPESEEEIPVNTTITI